VKTPDVGDAMEEVTCAYNSPKMEIGYNARYLLDILKTIESDDVTFLLDRTDNAGVVTPEGGDGDMMHQCLLMPLRLSD
jgi:DNA polymerase-3 subunit beta